MKNKKITLCIITCFAYNLTLFGDPIITFFIRPYPVMPDRKYCESLSYSLSHPGIIAEHCVNGIMNAKLSEGIFAAYGGYLNLSDANGHISFPYKHSKKSVSIIITHNIFPIWGPGNTVLHWQLEDNAKSAMFTMSQKTDDTAKISYWDTQQAKLPDDKKIPPQAIIIIAKPHDIYMPIGVTPTTESPSLLLPDIYAKQGIDHVMDTLYMLKWRHLFSPIHYQYKTDPAHNNVQIMI